MCIVGFTHIADGFLTLAYALVGESQSNIYVAMGGLNRKSVTAICDSDSLGT